MRGKKLIWWLAVAFLLVYAAAAVGQHTVTLTSYNYDGTNTTFCYDIWSDPSMNAVSHWVFEWCDEALIVSATPPPTEWPTNGDPTTGNTVGLKFETGLTGGQTVNFCITFLGYWPLVTDGASVMIKWGGGSGPDTYGAVLVDGPLCDFEPEPSVDIEKSTNGEDADTETGPYIAVGGAVNWEYVVENTGNVPLFDITVTDDVLGQIGFDAGPLLPGGQLTFTPPAGTAVAGQYSNLGSVVAYDAEQTEVTDEDPSHYFGSDPSVDIEKSTNGEDADAATGPYIPVGDPVNWEYVVENTGNVDLYNITVTDDVLGVIGTNAGPLAPGGTITFTPPAGTATAGQYSNLGTVVAYDILQTEVSDEDPSHYFGKDLSIDIEKATNTFDADDPTGPYVLLGNPVEWTYVVTNTGNVPLVDLEVTDNILGLICTHAGPLAVGDDFTCTASGTATTPGLYENIGTVIGYDGSPNGVGKIAADLRVSATDSDPSHYFAYEEGEPCIDIEKYTKGSGPFDDADTPTGPYIERGKPVHWRYVVTNCGDMTLFDIVVVDDKLGPISMPKTTLDPGESMQSHELGTAGQFQYKNNSTVTGVAPNEDVVTDQDPSHYFGWWADIDIEKHTNGEDADSPPGPTVGVGSTVLWEYIVTNLGNVTLTDVEVTDNILGYIGTIPSLGPGASATLTATGTAEPGQYANMGYVEGFDPEGKKVKSQDPSHYNGQSGFVPGGDDRRWVLARYQPWYADADADSALRHWDFNYMGGQADTSLFDYYDSYDPNVWGYNILLAWACGVDAFVVDWYGEESFETPALMGLLETAQFLYENFRDFGFDFQIAVSYNEYAQGRLDSNFIFIRDFFLTHPSYFGNRDGFRRPVFIFNQEDDIITPDEYRAAADTLLPIDILLLWNGTEVEAFGPMDVCYPWVQVLDGQWDPAGLDWGESYLDSTYWRMNFLPNPNDLLFALGGVWPGFDDREWSMGQNHWMDRQDTLVYHWTWDKVHLYDYPLDMPWCLVETWNDFNQATEVEPSVDWDYKFNVLTRDHARRFKWLLPPDSVGVENMGLLVPQHIHQARIAAELRPGEAANINTAIAGALGLFFARNHLDAISVVDDAIGIAPNPVVVDSDDGTSITISWDAAVNGTGYNVYYSPDQDHFEPCAFVKPEKVSVGDVTTYTITGLDPSIDYFIAVTVVDSDLGPYANESWYENIFTHGAVIHVPRTTFEATDVADAAGGNPMEFALHQNFPNPFNPVTTIQFSMPKTQHVKLSIYDLNGREVAILVDETKMPGIHSISYDAHKLSSGVYFYQIVTEEFTQIRKFLLMK